MFKSTIFFVNRQKTPISFACPMDGTCDLYPVQQVPRVSTNLVYPSTMSSTRTEYIPNRSAYDFEAAITLTVKRSRGYSISIPGTEIQGSIIDPPTYNYRIYSIPPWEALEVWTTTIQIDSICQRNILCCQWLWFRQVCICFLTKVDIRKRGTTKLYPIWRTEITRI